MILPPKLQILDTSQRVTCLLPAKNGVNRNWYIYTELSRAFALPNQNSRDVRCGQSCWFEGEAMVLWLVRCSVRPAREYKLDIWCLYPSMHGGIGGAGVDVWGWLIGFLSLECEGVGGVALQNEHMDNMHCVLTFFPFHSLTIAGYFSLTIQDASFSQGVQGVRS